MNNRQSVRGGCDPSRIAKEGIAVTDCKGDSPTPNSDRLRILYHHRTLGDGAEGIHVRELMAAFGRLGHEVRMVSLPGTEQGASRRYSPRFRLERIKRRLPRSAYELAEIGYNWIGKRNLTTAIRQFRPHFIYDRYNTFCTAAVRAGKAFGLPVFLEVNAPLAYERVAAERGFTFPRTATRYEAAICREASHIFAVSTPLKDFLLEHRGVPADRMTVVPNGADPEFFSPHAVNPTVSSQLRRELGFKADHKVIGFTGILRPWHGVEMLCTAFSRLVTTDPHVRLLIVGDGPSEDSIRRLVHCLNLNDRVIFTGRIPHERVRDYISIMQIAVSPRATFYASPMKLLEYMSMTVPVVAPDMPNIRDIVDQGTEGLLFAPDDEHALMQALHTLRNNPILRTSLGASGRRKVVENLNWRRNAEIVLDQFHAATNSS